MNIKTAKGDRQGKFPPAAQGKKYQKSLEALFLEGSRMAGADAVGVGKIFADAGIDAVMVGGLVVGCHTGRPRATQDLDVIVDVAQVPKTVITKLGKLVGAKTLEKHPSFISFIKKTTIGEREVLDVITSKAGSYGLVFEHHLALTVAGLAIKIPSVEMMIVLKYTAAISPIRPKAKQAQDWADIFAMIDANPKLSLYTAGYLADLVVPGWGTDLTAKIRAHRKSAI